MDLPLMMVALRCLGLRWPMGMISKTPNSLLVLGILRASDVQLISIVKHCETPNSGHLGAKAHGDSNFGSRHLLRCSP